MRPLLLRTADNCAAAAQVPDAMRLSSGVSVTLDVGLPSEKQRRIEARLNRLQTACGCVETSIALLSTLLTASYLSERCGPRRPPQTNFN
jgi:hypothetical protein